MPVCAVAQASGKSLYPESDTHNTWNGAIIEGPDGVCVRTMPRRPPRLPARLAALRFRVPLGTLRLHGG